MHTDSAHSSHSMLVHIGFHNYCTTLLFTVKVLHRGELNVFIANYTVYLSQGLHSASVPGILALDICLKDTSKIVTGEITFFYGY